MRNEEEERERDRERERERETKREVWSSGLCKVCEILFDISGIESDGDRDKERRIER